MIRRTVSTLAHHLGVEALWRNRVAKSVPVLMVHGVIDTDAEHEWLPLRSFLPLETFRNQINLLSHFYRFVSIDDARDYLRGHRVFDKRPIVVTLDDGQVNAMKYALPVLQEFGAPAILYPCTFPLDDARPFWFDRLDYAVQFNIDEPRQVDVAGTVITIAPSSRSKMQASFKLLVKVVKRSFSDDLFQFTEAVNRLIEEIESWKKNSLLDVYANDVVSRQLSADEIRSISDNELFEIGSHSVNHVRLAHLPDRVIEKELLESRNTLEEVTGKRCVSICYPDGSYNSRVSAMAARCGYETGFTSVEGSNRPGVNLLQMTRYNLSASFTDSELLCKASGMLDGFFDAQRGEYREA